SLVPIWLYLAFCEHDSVAAARALAVFGNKTSGPDAVQFSRAYLEGLVGRMKGDTAAAHAAFTEARAAQEQIVQAQPDYGPALCASRKSSPRSRQRMPGRTIDPFDFAQGRLSIARSADHTFTLDALGVKIG